MRSSQPGLAYFPHTLSGVIFQGNGIKLKIEFLMDMGVVLNFYTYNFSPQDEVQDVLLLCRFCLRGFSLQEL